MLIIRELAWPGEAVWSCVLFILIQSLLVSWSLDWAFKLNMPFHDLNKIRRHFGVTSNPWSTSLTQSKPILHYPIKNHITSQSPNSQCWCPQATDNIYYCLVMNHQSYKNPTKPVKYRIVFECPGRRLPSGRGANIQLLRADSEYSGRSWQVHL